MSATDSSNPLAGSSNLPRREGLAEHPIYARVFQPGKLTFGFIAPLEGYPHTAAPTMQNHLQMAKLADDLGFSAIWLRDVPFYDPNFGDVGQVFDPMVYAGWLAAATKRIAIGTAGVVLPLRDPLALAKQAVSIDQLCGGRFLLGLSTGDRQVEYPAFGVDYDNRAERFRDAHALLRATTESSFPHHRSRFYGRLEGEIDLVPKPVHSRLPMLAIGRCGQDVQWLASNMDGWIWHQSDFSRLADVVSTWRAACGHIQKPYGYGAFFDLLDDPDAPLQSGRGLRIGRNRLIELWRRQEAEGVAHVALNLKVCRRPAREVLEELAEFVLPEFG